MEKGGVRVVNVLSETTVAILNPLQAIWLKLVEVLPGLIARQTPLLLIQRQSSRLHHIPEFVLILFVSMHLYRVIPGINMSSHSVVIRQIPRGA